MEVEYLIKIYRKDSDVWRKIRAYGQSKLADKVGVHESYIGRIMKGGICSFKVMAKIKEILYPDKRIQKDEFEIELQNLRDENKKIKKLLSEVMECFPSRTAQMVKPPIVSEIEKFIEEDGS